MFNSFPHVKLTNISEGKRSCFRNTRKGCTSQHVWIKFIYFSRSEQQVLEDRIFQHELQEDSSFLSFSRPLSSYGIVVRYRWTHVMVSYLSLFSRRVQFRATINFTTTVPQSSNLSSSDIGFSSGVSSGTDDEFFWISSGIGRVRVSRPSMELYCLECIWVRPFLQGRLSNQGEITLWRSTLYIYSTVLHGNSRVRWQQQQVL